MKEGTQRRWRRQEESGRTWPCLGGGKAEWSDHLCKCAICWGSGGADVNTQTYFLIFSGLQTSRQHSRLSADEALSMYFLLSCLMLVKECNCWKVLPIPHPAWQLQSVSLCTRPGGWGWGGLSSNLPFSRVDIFLWFPSCAGWMRGLSPPVLLARSICAPPPWTLSLFSSLESIHYKNKVQDRFNFLSEMQRPLRISSLPSLLAPEWRWGQRGGPACDYSHMVYPWCSEQQIEEERDAACMVSVTTLR